MIKKATYLIVSIMIAALVGGCSTVPYPDKTTISYHGTGDVIEYYANGETKSRAGYLNGELVSVVQFFSSGTKESNEKYTQGEISEATYYFANGRVKTELIAK